tara:strand:- start:96 stop:1136 length:1041 start_codon:yes stop_codon:yes gene_type:complete
MRFLITSICLVAFFALGFAQDKEFKKADHILVPYGKEPRQVLHLWLPKTKSPAPLVLHFHGGGFLAGDIREKTRNQTAEMINAEGVAYADVEYRLLHTAMLQEIMRDCARALQFLRYNSKKYNLDKTRIGSYGESAGAGASLWLATHDDLADPQAEDPVLRESSRLTAAAGFWVQATYDVIQWPKILDLPEEKTPYWKFVKFWKAMLPEKRFNELRKDLDMLANMDKNDPPMMFTNGTPDKGVHSQRFVDALAKRAKEANAKLTISNDRKQLTKFMLTKLKVKQNKGSKPSVKPKRKEFPVHWGSPPKLQTRDYRKLPGGYGFGSSTLANWIQKNLNKDVKIKSRE